MTNLMGRRGRDLPGDLITLQYIAHFRGYIMPGLNSLPYRPTYGSGYSRYWDFGQFGSNPGLYNTLMQTPSYP